MTEQRFAGWSLIVIAGLFWIVNLGDVFTDLKEWHGAASPQFVGAALKQLGPILMAAVGGKLIPTRDRTD